MLVHLQRRQIIFSSIKEEKNEQTSEKISDFISFSVKKSYFQRRDFLPWFEFHESLAANWISFVNNGQLENGVGGNFLFYFLLFLELDSLTEKLICVKRWVTEKLPLEWSRQQPPKDIYLNLSSVHLPHAHMRQLTHFTTLTDIKCRLHCKMITSTL